MRIEGRDAYIKQEVNKKIFLTGLLNRRSVFLFHLCCPGRTLHSYTHRVFPGSFVPWHLTKAGRKAQEATARLTVLLPEVCDYYS